MEKKTLFGILAILAFISILFMPTGSKLWIYPLVLGVVFGIGWLRFK